MIGKSSFESMPRCQEWVGLRHFLAQPFPHCDSKNSRVPRPRGTAPTPRSLAPQVAQRLVLVWNFHALGSPTLIERSRAGDHRNFRGPVFAPLLFRRARMTGRLRKRNSKAPCQWLSQGNFGWKADAWRASPWTFASGAGRASSGPLETLWYSIQSFPAE